MSTRLTTSLQIKQLSKRKMMRIAERAERLGMTPQAYLRHLVDEDLAVSEQAKRSTFEQLLGPGQDTDEDEIDRAVEAARTALHRQRALR